MSLRLSFKQGTERHRPPTKPRNSEAAALRGASMALADRRLHRAGVILLESVLEVYNFFISWKCLV
jgi:hypothetical protein